MYKILLIEEQPELQTSIQSLFSDQEVFHSTSSQDLEKFLHKEIFDLILIDLQIPNSETFELCAKIRKDPRCKKLPIIIVSTQLNDTDALNGFSHGMDDFIIKPINPLIFRAKILNWLKRMRHFESEEVIYLQNFEIHPQTLSIVIHDTYEQMQPLNPVTLTPIEFKLLWSLTKHPGQVMARDQLIHEVWGHSTYVTDRVVDQHLCFLRKKLGNAGKQIKSVYGSGYIFSELEYVY